MLILCQIPHFVALRDGEKIGSKKGAQVDLAVRVTSFPLCPDLRGSAGLCF